VPIGLLRKQYGRSVMGEVLERAVNQGSQKAIADHELRPALRPKIEVTAFDEGADLEFTMALEVLPEVPAVDLNKIELVRPVAEVSETTLAGALDNFSKSLQQYEAPAEPRPSQTGDRLIIDFEGRVDGAPFQGGKAEDVPLVLGSGFMLPGFEDQLTGVEQGTEIAVDVEFPEGYPNPDLAGKPATFAVSVKEIAQPKPLVLDDDLAKAQGFDGLDALKTAIRERFARDYAQLSRARVKRALLDHLAENYPFQVPAGMVDLEFEAIWKQLKEEMERTGEELAEGKSEEELKEEYRAIAERRVRLGLILSDIGQNNQLKVEQHELNAAIAEQARRYPGQEQKVLDFFRNNPSALEHLRAPLYEDKVVDFILQLANVSERQVTPEELMAEPEADATGETAAGAAVAAAVEEDRPPTPEA
jgi:trigger factor